MNEHCLILNAIDAIGVSFPNFPRKRTTRSLAADGLQPIWYTGAHIQFMKEIGSMNEHDQEQLSEQDLSEGELVDQEPLEPVEDPPSRLAGNNLVPDFGDDTAGTLHDAEDKG